METKMSKQLTAQHKAWVMETVDLIRMRKARPDLDRISRMLKRIYGLNFNETRDSLESLVEEGKINRVHFKGNVSYRRAQPPERSPDCNAQSTTHRITNAIQTITKQTGDGVTFADLEQWMLYKNPNTRLVKQRLQTALMREVKAKTITLLSDDCYVLTESLPKQEKAKEFKPIVSPKPKAKQASLKVPKNPEAPTIEVEETRLIDKKGNDNSQFAVKQEPQTMMKDEDPDIAKRGRPLSKRKKFKKTHGPDFEDPMNIRRLTNREKVENEFMCDQCSCTAQSNKDGIPEPLLTCKDCNAKAHPSCLEYSERLAQRALNSPWQCMECKDCCVCDGADNADLMLFCDECDKGYHMTCHSPPLTNKPKGTWVCSACKKLLSKEDSTPTIKAASKKNSTKTDTVQEVLSKELEDQRLVGKGTKRKLSQDRLPSEVKRQRSNMSCSSSNAGDTFIDGTVGAPSLPTPSASPRPSDTFDYEMKMASVSERLLFGNDSTKYEDATDWTINEVVNFFSENGYKDQSKVFQEQEIDGRSLLLMKRNDVLTALGLRLGPALKIYQKVLRLQQHSQSATFS